MLNNNSHHKTNNVKNDYKIAKIMNTKTTTTTL